MFETRKSTTLHLLFERGAFDARAFFALEDSRTPLKVTVVSAVIGVGLSFLLIGPLAHGGLALAISASLIFSNGALAWALRRRLGHLGGRAIVVSFFRAASASVFLGIIAAFTYGLAAGLWPGAGFAAQALRLTAAGAAGGLSYLVAMFALRAEEIGELRALLRGPRRRAAARG